ncbi:MAG: MotA/TolQ/ExbB proton channel family protein [Methylotenera sp.]|nr:MotA/TolQ/ExbB proton channel family protein [Methylotenera sp.]MDD4925013.1 MotA/TolQ/ExbB proton channel family protein [Methylotenera sp.]NOU40836.1 MotA/TolQ/ExbB proton channel family protein [Methylotenera sp.]
MNALESLLYEVSKWFLTPVLVVLTLMFIYALFAFGMLMFDVILRLVKGRGISPLLQFAKKNPHANQETLELHLLKLIEPLRITSRIAPMLGLVATMIPMGPALIAVSSGDSQGIAQNLIVAFSAVIVALLAAAITYLVLSIRRRWLLHDLNEILSSKIAITVAPDHRAGVVHG